MSKEAKAKPTELTLRVVVREAAILLYTDRGDLGEAEWQHGDPPLRHQMAELLWSSFASGEIEDIRATLQPAINVLCKGVKPNCKIVPNATPPYPGVQSVWEGVPELGLRGTLYDSGIEPGVVMLRLDFMWF